MRTTTVLPLVEVGEVLPGVLGRVDPAHRGPVSRGDQLADGVDAVGELVDQEAEVPVVLRLVAEELDRHLGDEAQRALAADHDVADVRARGPAGHVLDPGDLPAGEDGLQAHHQVFDPAVQGGELADRPGGDQAAQLSERLGLRRVPRGQAAGPHGVLQHLQADAALHGGHHVDRVDRQDRVHPRPVDHQAVLDHGLQATLRRGPAGAGDDVDEVVCRRTGGWPPPRRPTWGRRSRPGSARRRCRGRYAALGEAVGSIHRIGALAQGLEACNGWTFWHIETPQGLTVIDTLREKVRSEMAAA